MKSNFTSNTHNSLDGLVPAVNFLHPDDVVAEVKCFKSALLPEQHEHAAAGPVQALAEHLPFGISCNYSICND